MSNPTRAPLLSHPTVSPELHAALIQEAHHDADRVAEFLRDVIARLERKNQCTFDDRWKCIFPPGFYLRMAAALKILEWEGGDLATPEMQLPLGIEALADATGNSLTCPDDAPLLSHVLRVFVQFFAWSFRTELGASVVLGELNEDQLAGQIADYLWAHRHDLE